MSTKTKRIKKPTAKSLHPRRLYRPLRGRILGGVCAGIAEFTGIDPTIVRLVFVLTSFLGGSAILAYLIMWLIIPSEEEEGEISENTIKNSTQEIKEKTKIITQQAKYYTESIRNRQSVGVILMILGLFFLLQNFGVLDLRIFSKLWPLLLILIAIYIIFKDD